MLQAAGRSAADHVRPGSRRRPSGSARLSRWNRRGTRRSSQQRRAQSAPLSIVRPTAAPAPTGQDDRAVRSAASVSRAAARGRRQRPAYARLPARHERRGALRGRRSRASACAGTARSTRGSTDVGQRSQPRRRAPSVDLQQAVPVRRSRGDRLPHERVDPRGRRPVTVDLRCTTNTDEWLERRVARRRSDQHRDRPSEQRPAGARPRRWRSARRRSTSTGSTRPPTVHPGSAAAGRILPVSPQRAIGPSSCTSCSSSTP